MRHRVLEEVSAMGKRNAERYRLTVRGTGRKRLEQVLAEAVWRRYRAER